MTGTLVAAATTNDQVAAATAAFWRERLELTGVIVERAITAASWRRAPSRRCSSRR